jgi:glycosyltransferase involved in cell wall biosynthesis
VREDVAAIIPAFEAGKTIGAVVADVRGYCARIVVVDDGSADDTAARAASAGAEVLRHAVNSGKGAAIITGMKMLGRDGMARVLTLDADGQHLGSEIPALLAASDGVPHAIVVGVRKKAGHPIAFINRVGNWFADRVLRLVAGRPLPDTQSGFRIYPVAATLALDVQSTRYDFETEVLLRAARRGMNLIGVPVAVYYPPVAERVSHYRPTKDTLRIIRTVLRSVFRSR